MALTKLTTDLIDSTIVTSVNGSTGAVTLETGTDWQATPKTADFTAVAGEGYFVDTTSTVITVTLPSSPTAGDELTIVDYAGTADTNNITITSSDNINGSSNDVKIDYERGGVSMVYVDATQGWIAYNAANETAAGLIDNPPVYNIDYLLAAGGGGGGRAGDRASGGGGAGGLLQSTISNISLGETLTITIGAGGSGVYTGYTTTYPGTQSSIESTAITNIIAYGGGGGGGEGVAPSTGTLGSGGGGSQASSSGGIGTSGQGNNGGTARTSSPYHGGGGGGAGAVGGNGGSGSGGVGGVGSTSTIISTTNATTSSIGEVDSSNLYFAGGGGGAGSSAGGSGGLGGGGNGSANISIDSGNGSDNSGGGGGAHGWNGNTGSGGSGVCVLKMPTADYSGTTTGSPDVYTEGSNTVLVFKTSGSYTT